MLAAQSYLEDALNYGPYGYCSYSLAFMDVEESELLANKAWLLDQLVRGELRLVTAAELIAIKGAGNVELDGQTVDEFIECDELLIINS